MTSLNWPPEEWPKSAENWFWRTLNSATASLGTLTIGPVTARLLLSMPSTVKLLLVGRWPPTEGAVPYPAPPLLVTPAASKERFKTPDLACPPLAEGRSA